MAIRRCAGCVSTPTITESIADGSSSGLEHFRGSPTCRARCDVLQRSPPIAGAASAASIPVGLDRDCVQASWFGWGFRPDGAAWLRPTHAVSGRGRISFSTRSLRRLCAQSVRHAPAHCLYTVPTTAWCHSSPARLWTGCGRAASMPSYSRYPALVIVSSAPIRIRRPKPASKHFGGRWCSLTKCCNRGVDPYRPFVNPVADSTTPAAGPRHADGGTAAATLRSSTR